MKMDGSVEFRDTSSGCLCWIKDYPAKRIIQLVTETLPDKRHVTITIREDDVEDVAAVFRRFQAKVMKEQ